LIGLAVSFAVFSVLKGKEERKSEPFDFWGALTLTIGYPSLLIALSLGAKSSWTSSYIPMWFVLSALGLFSFALIEIRAKSPLIHPSFIRSLPLSASMLSLALNSAVHYPIFILGPLYMQNVLEFSPLKVGLVATTLPLLTAITSPISGRLADRTDARLVAALGLFFTVVGIFIYSRLGPASDYLSVMTAFAFIGVGTGFFLPANQRAAFSTVSNEHYGMLSAMLSSFGPAAGTVGTTIAVALLGGTMTGAVVLDPEAFSNAQQFAFSSLLPFAVIAIFVCLAGRWKKSADN
jgi:MFS family permease